MEYLSNRFMLDLLKRAQEAQLKVMMMNKGNSLHLDANNSPRRTEDGNYVSFSVYLFENNAILQNWEFRPWESEELLEHNMQDLMFHINTL